MEWRRLRSVLLRPEPHRGQNRCPGASGDEEITPHLLRGTFRRRCPGIAKTKQAPAHLAHRKASLPRCRHRASREKTRSSNFTSLIASADRPSLRDPFQSACKLGVIAAAIRRVQLIAAQARDSDKRSPTFHAGDLASPSLVCLISTPIALVPYACRVTLHAVCRCETILNNQTKCARIVSGAIMSWRSTEPK